MNLNMIATAVALTLLAGAAQSAEFTINMVNKDSTGKVMQFEPAYLKVAPGDTVHFVPVDKGHDTESLYVPDGVEGWKSKLSQPLDVTFTTEGFYAFKCAPHFAMGMVGLIEVGEGGSSDPVTALKAPKKAHERFEELLDEAAAAQ
jgi:pseudoazurin